MVFIIGAIAVIIIGVIVVIIIGVIVVIIIGVIVVIIIGVVFCQQCQKEIAAERDLAAKEKKKSLALYWGASQKVRMVAEQVHQLPEVRVCCSVLQRVAV